MRFSAFNAQVNWLQNVGSGILNFWPENYLEPPKVKKKIEKFFLTLEGSKEFGGQKFKIPLPTFGSQFSCLDNAANRIPIS